MTRTSQHGDTTPDPAVMLTLAEAIALRQGLDLRYVSREDASTRRTVHPYSLMAHSDRRYLVAFDTDQQEERTFRVDRVRSVRTLLRIRATEDRIRAHLPRSVARLEQLHRGQAGMDGPDPPWYRTEIRAESLDWLPSVIAAFDCEVTIEGPDELRDGVRAAAARILRAADDGMPSTGT